MVKGPIKHEEMKLCRGLTVLCAQIGQAETKAQMSSPVAGNQKLQLMNAWVNLLQRTERHKDKQVAQGTAPMKQGSSRIFLGPGGYLEKERCRRGHLV